MRALVSCLLVSLLGLAVLLSCGTGEDDQNGSRPMAMDLPDQVLLDTETFLTKAGRRTGIVRSETLKVYSNQDTTLLYGLEVDFFDSSGALTSTLTADSGRITDQSTAFAAFGDVRARSGADKRLLTDSLRWNTDAGTIETEGFVMVIRQQDTLSGWGLQTDARLENIEIKRRIRGSFHAPESDSS
jgi:LPS export ABC transporter protein LptC